MGFENHSIVFSSSIKDLSSINSSFDRGIMQIAYHGKNQNGSFISKQSFEDAIPSMFNCPIVCNYNRQTDSIGAHDVEIVKNDDGIYMVNVTQPIGVVPESAKYWWEEVTEADGRIEEYLCTEILVWRRQEAYDHVKENGITDESMEIKVHSGAKEDDGLFHIYSFEFTAFCLLESANPCFESAGIEMFSAGGFRERYAAMMEDFKREFSKVMTASADDNTDSSLKGGNDQVNIDEMMARYGLSAEDIDFETEGLEPEEIESRFAAIAQAKSAQFEEEADEPGEEPDTETETESEPDADPVDEPADEPVDNPTDEPAEEPTNDDDDDVPPPRRNYSLTNRQLEDSLWNALMAVTFRREGWEYECHRYWMVDFSTEVNEVYAEDNMNGYLVGMPFSMNGDNVVIDFDAAKRKLVAFVDFDEGNVSFNLHRAFEAACAECNAQFDSERSELERLRKFEQESLEAKRAQEIAEVFSRFVDLNDNEMFEALKSECSGMTVAQIEDKCFSIRGRAMASGELKFSASGDKPIQLPIENVGNTNHDEPYGGIFAKYGIGDR